MSEFSAIRHLKKRAFLAAYARVGTILHAAKLARLHRNSHLNWLRDDPVYATLFETVAKPMALERLEAEAIRRGEHGVRKPVYQGKELVGYVQEYSDTLLIFVLKSLAPEKYRDRVEHTGTIRHDVQIDLTQLTRRELEQYRLLTAKAERVALPARVTRRGTTDLEARPG